MLTFHDLGVMWRTILVATDKTMIKGDFLIDSLSSPHGSFQPEWTHIVYTQPYNTQSSSKRIQSWKTWKQVLGFGQDEDEIPFYVHGSEDSSDVDTMYLFKKLPEKSECQKFCSGCADDRSISVYRQA